MKKGVDTAWLPRYCLSAHTRRELIVETIIAKEFGSLILIFHLCFKEIVRADFENLSIL